MEIELEPRVKPLSFKVKGMSRESPSQKASFVLDTDLRSHWSTGTNTKEWILLELDEPCLLSHLRIYNKSVLEWEISVGLRYKPETFVKVRPRCEAPRRDMIYPMNYTPSRYVRISCLRGNPIAIFFIQLIGVSVSGLEPEFQPVINHLLPNIVSHKQDAQDMHLQLLQDMTNRLLVFLPQLEADLASFSDAGDQNLRFLAMLAGPWYPILHIVNERETVKSSGNVSDSEVSKNSQLSSSLTVSSNFQPRRSRGMTAFTSSNSSSMVFRSDAIFILLRKAYKESDLGHFCRTASSILYKLTEPVAEQEVPTSASEVACTSDEIPKTEASSPLALVDYSSLLGEEFHLPDDNWDLSILNVLDIGAVEEGILHVLYACASQPMLCHRLAESSSEFWSALPLVQALLPALRPSMSSLGEIVDDSFSQWQQPFVQQALSQIVAMSCSVVCRPLLHACAGYLSSYSPSHAKAACVLIDLCSSVLSPWMAMVIAKVDLTVELLEDLLGTIQGARHSPSRARAALKYVVLALSGHMDDILGKYKEVKHKILFLLEMLEPFLDPAIYAPRNSIAFGDVSLTFMEKQEQTCVAVLNIIRIAVQKPAVLSSLESEWRRGSVAPSVLLSILEPRMQLPPEIDLCKSPTSKIFELEALAAPSQSSVIRYSGTSSKSNSQDGSDGKVDTPDNSPKVDVFEDESLLFAPIELRTIVLTNVSSSPKEPILDSSCKDPSSELKHAIEKKFTDLFPNGLLLDVDDRSEYFNLQADYFQLVNYRDCEIRASEFRRLALDLHSQNNMTVEGHDAAIDALLLAAECYVNPFFMMSFKSCPKTTNPVNTNDRSTSSVEFPELGIDSKKTAFDMEKIALLEKKRDKIVLQILLEAAELDRKFQRSMSDGESLPCHHEDMEEQVINLTSSDVESADAVTLIRQNQSLLCGFVIRWLKREQHSMHEILMHCLIFLLHSATHLLCAPEEVIDIALGSAEYLNAMLTTFYQQSKEGNLQLDLEKIHGVQRRWALLQRLVIASAGGEGSNFSVNVNNRYQWGSLIPPSAWVQRISIFSHSSYPLVRFLGWMAISRNAERFIRDRLFLASDLSQLTCLLSIFSDELAAVDNVLNQGQNGRTGKLGFKTDSLIHQRFEFFDPQHGDQSFRAIYPDLNKFFPNLKKQFEAFGEHILEAVGLQLQSLSSTVVPDILCWFSDVCSWQFLRNNHIASHNVPVHLKGYVAKNAKAIILYILEAIVIEHMEAIVPEMPRVVQVLVSLCRASYCDVPFLESIMCLLKPLISYSLSKVSDEEKTLVDDHCLNFESLCFQELFVNITQKNENGDVPAEKESSKALIIFILASVFSDLSFQRRIEILNSLALWADFTSFEPTTSFHDYLCSFQTVMESCKVLLVQTLKAFGFLPIQLDKFYGINEGSHPDSSLEKGSWFLSDICPNIYPPKPINSEKMEIDDSGLVASKQNDCHLSMEEIEDFSKGVENIIEKLNPTLELCWNLHHHLVKKLVIISAECFVYSRCLSSVGPQVGNAEDDSSENSFTKPVEDFSVHWSIGIQGLADVTIKLQENHCWEISSLVLDCLLGVPFYFQLDNVMDAICYAIKSFSCCAPKIVWRLRSDKWLSMLFVRGIHNLHESEKPLTDLFGTLLCHAEPEQRFIALKHLARLVGQAANGGAVLQSKIFCSNSTLPALAFPVPQPFLSLLVSSTWDQVVLLASSHTLLTLRIHAMTLLVSYMPYASQHHLRSFLAGADSVLHVLGKTGLPRCGGPLLRLALALVAGACLYSSTEDISLIPHEIWSNIERIGLSRTGVKVGDLEKNACEVLCKLKSEGDVAKEALREALYLHSSKEVDSEFGSTREAILQVLSNLTSVRSYFEIFSEKMDEQAMELEEAEMELDILQRENSVEESSKHTKEISSVGDSGKHGSRLQEIKARISSLEKTKLQEHIIARRQRKLLVKCARQKYMEEAALREEELLRELDRERTAEAEKEIERQRLLEFERAKTRELRHNLDMEKERQMQRELQRELEQAESGLRSSRREFSSSTNSRARDRYRERENARSGSEGGTRPSSEISSASASIVLSGSRAFSGQTPTILQSRDECGSSYEENLEGSKDSGDTGSMGDPELMSAFEGQSGGQRHGSRGTKSRQLRERREGKWERKHS